MHDFYFKIPNGYKHLYLKKVEGVISAFNLESLTKKIQDETHISFNIKFDNRKAKDEFISALKDKGVHFSLSQDL